MFARFYSDTFTMVWNGASIVTLFLPLVAFSVARLGNDYDWEQQGGDNQNNVWSDYNNPDNYDEYGKYIGPDHWWQFWKKDGEGQNNDNRTPWWYIWGEQDPHNEDEGGDGTMLFVYIWTLVALAGMVYLGNTTGMTVDKLHAFRLALIGFANSCFITMVLIGGLHVIQSEGPEVEEDGWYGQIAVLLLLTTAFGLAQSVAFITWAGKRIKKMSAAAIEDKADGYVNVVYESPAVQA